MNYVKTLLNELKWRLIGRLKVSISFLCTKYLFPIFGVFFNLGASRCQTSFLGGSIRDCKVVTVVIYNYFVLTLIPCQILL